MKNILERSFLLGRGYKYGVISWPKFVAVIKECYAST